MLRPGNVHFGFIISGNAYVNFISSWLLLKNLYRKQDSSPAFRKKKEIYSNVFLKSCDRKKIPTSFKN